MGSFVLDPCVEEELWAIWEFIAKDNPDAATRVVEAAYLTFKTLAANPGLGRERRFENSLLRGVRSWLVAGFDSYLIFYRPHSDGIQILHVYHGARDIESLFDG
jgi:toxin ParE1/3/4